MSTSSRLTYRKKSTTAYQKLKRDEKEKNYTGYKYWKNISLSLKTARVKGVERKTAEKIIFEYEWLGDMAVTNKYYGIFFESYCAGVICIFTKGYAPKSHMRYGVKNYEVSYFARGACTFWSPIGTASKLLSYALKMEKQRGCKVACAFADTDAGEYGTVYQATNWLCLGKTSSNLQWVKNNRVFDQRTMTSALVSRGISYSRFRQNLLKDNWIEQKANPKYKYVFITADEPERTNIYNRIKNLIIKYPKRPEKKCVGNLTVK